MYKIQIHIAWIYIRRFRWKLCTSLFLSDKVHCCFSSDLRPKVEKINCRRAHRHSFKVARLDITMVLIFNSQPRDIVSEDLAAFFFPRTPYSSSSRKNKIKRKTGRKEPLSSRGLIKNVRLLRSVKSASRPHLPLGFTYLFRATTANRVARNLACARYSVPTLSSRRLLFVFARIALGQWTLLLQSEESIGEAPEKWEFISLRAWTKGLIAVT